ncbi:hypothetical protein ENUP19_0378G0029 [Entamoeba nuttalli]|uniref:Prefoldin, alpha subunit protein n=2 Tax=Entamoeba nuttalli TaxID=412467 RepID=K2G5U2_ENTNP|nr:prefoldin, alpha subunit protein [Entamoeba nuttalli P19]EKE37721.1 prefoldin, alpha subunit protein [Entamoeba nuttalli P19]|eukprot:XP_008859944.1 prefoldin, alpha subunit protein [Entamoeba nuttalli P19]
MTEREKVHQETEDAIHRADEFVQTIERDMLCIDDRINAFRLKQQGYELLLVHTNSIQSADKETLVNIGEGIHVKAEFNKKNMMLVGVGLGFYLEVSINEAKEIAQKQIERLEMEIQHDLLELAKRKATLTLTNQGKQLLEKGF